MMTSTNGCGTKHLKLACWVIGLLLGAQVTVGLLCGRGQGDAILAQQEATRKLDERLRIEEQGGAKRAATLESLDKSINRIESAMLRIEAKLDKSEPQARRTP
jgi:hypothetical protein